MIAPTLRSFVPPALIRAAASATDNDLRDATRFHAAVLFADISGFSAMMDALMAHGQHGAEVGANIMRAALDPAIDAVYQYGGFVSSQAGDGGDGLRDQRILVDRVVRGVGDQHAVGRLKGHTGRFGEAGRACGSIGVAE